MNRGVTMKNLYKNCFGLSSLLILSMMSSCFKAEYIDKRPQSENSEDVEASLPDDMGEMTVSFGLIKLVQH